MSFPPVPRVVYKTNPLEEVICQLKFPPILRIDSELPAKFQESLRRDYPLFQQAGPAIPAVFETGLSAALTNLRLPISLSAKVYNFISADEKWKVATNTTPRPSNPSRPVLQWMIRARYRLETAAGASASKDLGIGKRETE